MGVRFLPVPEEQPSDLGEDRENLAEVVDLRSRLSKPAESALGPNAAAPKAEAVVATAHEPVAPPEQNISAEGVAPAVPIHTAAWAALAGWEEGAAQETSAQVDEATAEASPEERAEQLRADGVRLLARKARSSGELREELLRLEHDVHDVDVLIAEFEADLYLDDLGLARATTEKLRDSKRASRTQIRMKLRDRRLPDSVIEEALGELDADEEYELLREAAEERARKLSGLDRQTAERRLLGFLARRGWSGEPAMRAAREALSGGASGGAGRGSVRFH